MSVFKIGSRYKLMSHPNQPIGIPIRYDIISGDVVVEWENTYLIPRVEHYPEHAFADGTFQLVDDPKTQGGDANCWNHDWKSYTGLKETYEYCTKCDMKRR